MRITALLIVLLLGGCERVGQVVGEEIRKSVVSSTVVVAPPLHTPSDEQVNRFVEAMLKASADNDPQAVADLIDWDAFVLRTLAGIDLEDTFDTARFAASTRRDFTNSGLAAQIPLAVKHGGSFRMLDVRKRGLETWMVFRLLLPEGGLEHVSFLLSAREDGKTRVVDISLLSQGGGPMSEMIRRLLLPTLTQENRGLLERLTDGEALLMKHLDKVEAMMAARAEGDSQAALKIYRTLPARLQEDRALMQVRVEMAAGVDDATYQQAISDMQRLFPDDPANAMLAIDANFMRGRWDGALEAVDVAARNSTPDPYFDFLRASIMVSAGRLPEAEAAARTATTKDPELEDGWWALLNSLIKQRKYEEASAVILEIERRFAFEFDFEAAPEYDDFRQSKAYAELQKTWAASAAAAK